MIDYDFKEFNKDNLISEVASRLNLYKDSVEEVYTSLENYVIELLMKSDENYNTSIKLFNGVYLQSIYEGEKVRLNNFDKTEYTIKPKLKFRTFFTAHFKNEKNKTFRADREKLGEWYSDRKKAKLSNKKTNNAI